MAAELRARTGGAPSAREHAAAPIALRTPHGLANRLRALAGCRALADERGAPLVVDWVRNGHCDRRFDDLFERRGWEAVRFAERGAPAEGPAGVRIDGSPCFTAVWAEHSREPEPDFCRRSVAYLRSLRPTAGLRERIDAYAEAHGLSECVGVHIRHTDNLSDHRKFAETEPSFDLEKVSRLDGFYALIDALCAGGRPVFVCTDAPDVAREVAARHDAVKIRPLRYDACATERHLRRRAGRGPLHWVGTRVRARLDARRGPRTWRTTPIEDGLIDLFLLGRCRSIVGTYYSSFSEIGALIGDVPLSVMEGAQPAPHAATGRIRALARGVGPVH